MAAVSEWGAVCRGLRGERHDWIEFVDKSATLTRFGGCRHRLAGDFSLHGVVFPQRPKREQVQHWRNLHSDRFAQPELRSLPDQQTRTKNMKRLKGQLRQ